MAIATTASLVDALRQSQVLEPGQLDEVVRQLHRRFRDPRALAKELIKRGWLTPYQVNQLFAGKGRELLLGPYVLLERLGEGGMGQVFKARHPIMGRLVALKLIRKDRLSKPDAIRRFEREIRAAAQLSHPNIVTAFDADRVGDTHFFVMEYVEGMDLSKMVKQCGPLPIEQACAYIRQAALGLQHAHERGLVHRDIKPGNLLLSVKEGVVKILDMGLARVLEGEEGDSTSPLTETDAVVGTPDYAAPEQARQSHAVDIRADLYSLGCTFYYFLAGRLPFPGGTTAEKLVRHQLDEPEPVENLRAEIPAGLATIVRRLMAKRPDDRFQSPAELVAVLDAGLATGRWPVQAPVPGTSSPGAPPITSIRSGPNTARVPGAGLVGQPSLLARWSAIFRSPQTARLTESMARLRQRVATGSWLGLKGAAAAAGGLLAFFFLWLIWPDFRPPLDRLARSKVPEAERFSWQPPELVEVIGSHQWKHWRAIRGVVASPDGKIVASGGDDLIRIWDAATGKEQRAIPVGAAVTCLAISPDGRTFFSGTAGGALQMWDVATGNEKRVRFAPYKMRVSAVAFVPDGQTVVSIGQELENNAYYDFPKIWEMNTGKELAVLKTTGGSGCLAVSSDGRTLATGDFDAAVRLWDLPAGKERVKLPMTYNTGATCLCFSPDGKTLFTGSLSEGRFWDVDSGQVRLSLQGVQSNISKASFAPHGGFVAGALDDYSLSIWDSATGREQARLAWAGKVNSLAVSRDAQTVIAGCEDRTIRLWNLTGRKDLVPLPTYELGSVAPDGRSLALMEGEQLVVWDIAGRKPRLRLTGHKAGIMQALFSPDGKLLASSSSDGTVKFWDAASGKELTTLPVHVGPVHSIAFAPDGKSFVSAASTYGPPAKEEMRLWDLAGGPGKMQERLSYVMTGKDAAGVEFTNDVGGLVFTTDSQALITRGHRNGITSWDLSAEKPKLNSGNPFNYSFTALALAPQGDRAAAARADNLSMATIKLFDIASCKELDIEFKGVFRTVHSMAFSPDGKMLVSASNDGWLIIWDPATGKKLKEWQLPGPIWNVAFAADGRHLVLGNGNWTVYVLRLAS